MTSERAGLPASARAPSIAPVRAVVGVVGELLLTAGVLVLLFTGYLVYGTAWEAEADQQAASAELDRRWAAAPVVPVPAAPDEPAPDLPGRRVVAPGDRSVIAAVPGARLLTLTTCHPRFSARQRLIVHAVLDRAQPRAQGRPVELGEPPTSAPQPPTTVPQGPGGPGGPGGPTTTVPQGPGGPGGPTTTRDSDILTTTPAPTGTADNPPPGPCGSGGSGGQGGDGGQGGSGGDGGSGGPGGSGEDKGKGGDLAWTGVPVLDMVLFGSVILLLGLVLVLAARHHRRRERDEE